MMPQHECRQETLTLDLPAEFKELLTSFFLGALILSKAIWASLLSSPQPMEPPSSSPAAQFVEVPRPQPAPVVPETPPTQTAEPRLALCTASSESAAVESGIDPEPPQTAATVPAAALLPAPAPPGSRNDSPAFALLGDGIHKFWNRRYQQAIERFQSAIDLDPTAAAPLYFLALAHGRLGNRDLARQFLARAAQTEATHGAPNLGRFLERIQGTERLWLEDARRNLAL